jgi:hypothetical protein
VEYIRKGDDFSYGAKRQKVSTAIENAFASDGKEGVNQLVKAINEKLQTSGSDLRVSANISDQGGNYSVTTDPLKLRLTTRATAVLELKDPKSKDSEDELKVSVQRDELVWIHKSRTIPYEMSIEEFDRLCKQSEIKEQQEKSKR